jgi:hydroxymethylpyrimidine pyrophosphatase-like HAD family hydrolase
MEKVIKNPTLFVDIDGTLVKYRKFAELQESILTPIQEVIDFVNSQYDSGGIVIITTARPEKYRHFTVLELNQIGVKWHQLVMECGRGTRVILNDRDPENPIDRAVGINLERDKGFQSLDGAPQIDAYEL